MKMYRVLSLVSSIIVLAILYIYYSEISYLGFPFSELTEFEKAEKQLFRILFIPNLLIGFYYAFLAITSSSDKVKTYFKTATLCYLVLLALRIALTIYFGTTLDSGHGG